MSLLVVDNKVLVDSPSLVLFDKDGTLVDIHHYWVSMIRLRADLISQRLFAREEIRPPVKAALESAMGVDQETNRMKFEGPVGVKPRPEIVDVVVRASREYGAITDSNSIESMFKEVDETTSIDMKPLVKILPGVVDLLDQLRSHNIPAAIVTTDITERAKKAMGTVGLSRYFIDIVGGDIVEKTKPHSDLAEYVLSKSTVFNKNVVVIGDHPVDVEMGLAAGISTNIGVLTGLSDAAAFHHLDCTTVRDLTKVVVR